MQLRSNDLDGGIAFTSQSIAISANVTSSLLDVNMVQGMINLFAGADVNISSSLGTTNIYGTGSMVGELNVIFGPLNVSSSSGTPFGINVYNDGIYSEGFIETDNGLQIGINSGSQYPYANILIDSGSYPTDIYAGYQVYDPTTFYTAIAVVGNTYTSQYPGQVVGYIAGGGLYSGSDAAILLPASNAVVEVVKPLKADAGATITGSVFVSGSGGFGLQVQNSGIYTEGNTISRGSIRSVGDGNEIAIWSNLEGSGSYFANFNAVISGSADTFGGYNIPTNGSAQDMGMVINSYTAEHFGTPIGMIYAGGNNGNGSNTALAFPADGTMEIHKNTIVSGSLTVTGGINYASGSNTTVGTVALNNGNPSTASISNSLVTANSLIFLTKQTLTNAHSVAVSSKGSGTFTITSSGNGDSDIVAYQIINPA